MKQKPKKKYPRTHMDIFLPSIIPRHFFFNNYIMGFITETPAKGGDDREKMAAELIIFRENLKHLCAKFTEKVGGFSIYCGNKLIDCGVLSEEDKETFRGWFNTFSAEFLSLKKNFFNRLRDSSYIDILQCIGTNAADLKNRFESAESYSVLANNILYYSTLGDITIQNASLEYKIAGVQYIYKLKPRDYHLIRSTIDEILYIIDDLFAALEKKYTGLASLTLIETQVQKYIRDNKDILMDYEEKLGLWFS